MFLKINAIKITQYKLVRNKYSTTNEWSWKVLGVKQIEEQLFEFHSVADIYLYKLV